MEKTILAIDLGSQWIRVALAQEDDEGKLHIPVFGVCPAKGIANGEVKNLERLRDCIYAAMVKLQEDWGEDIDPAKMPVYYSVSGNKVSGVNTDTGMRDIFAADHNTKIGEVSERDIEWLKNSLESSVIPNGFRKISMITQCFRVDDTTAIENPIGLNGQEIQAAGHLVIDTQSHIANLENVISKALAIDNGGIEDENIKLIPVAGSLASAYAVLTEEQKEAGVAVLDIGEGCCDLSVFFSKYPVLTWCGAGAGGSITREIKSFLNIGINEAEKIKEDFAYATPDRVGNKETVEVPAIDGGTNRLGLETLAAWVKPAVEHLFSSIKNALGNNIENTTYKGIISQNGLVITGGSAKLKDISIVAMEMFELPVKIGKPNIVKIDEFPQLNEDPSFSTLIGLCLYGMQNYEFSEGGKKRKKPANKAKAGGKPAFGSSLKSGWGNFVETIKNIQIS